jgi:hypothetical protein
VILFRSNTDGPQKDIHNTITALVDHCFFTRTPPSKRTRRAANART